jgi:hypothetical protein
MGVAYYVVLEDGSQPEMDGKTLARLSKTLDVLSKKHSLSYLHDFFGMSGSEFAELIGEDLDIPEQAAQWFTPEAGLAMVGVYLTHIDEPPTLVADLLAFHKALELACASGTRWHLSVDI